jgi:hypothetical protein
VVPKTLDSEMRDDWKVWCYFNSAVRLVPCARRPQRSFVDQDGWVATEYHLFSYLQYSISSLETCRPVFMYLIDSSVWYGAWYPYAWTAIWFSDKWDEFLPTTAVRNVDKVKCLLLSDRILDGYAATWTDVWIKPSRIWCDERRRLFLELVTFFWSTRWMSKMNFGGTGKQRLESGNRRLVHVFGLQRQCISFPRTPFVDPSTTCISFTSF